MTSLAAARLHRTRTGLLRDLERPSDVFAHLTPNWFAVVMGTGIVAVAAATLPYQPWGLHGAAILMWALAATVLVVLVVATGVHWWRHPGTARGHLDHPVMAHFHGAAPMAALTVGAGTLLVGRDVVGPGAAVAIDAVLWTVGTAGGILTAVAIPVRVVRHQRPRAADAFGGWLMPVVPPMVSASTGALLVPHVPAGPAQLTMLFGCGVLFVLAVLASAFVITLVVRRVARHGAGEARLVPTLWIVLGPLGQSVTAANLLGGVAHDALPARDADVLHAAAVGYGLPVLALALAWAGVAAAVTVRTARAHLPFGLTWWSFTFPVGTVVTGTSGLAVHTGSTALGVVAVALFLALVGAWLTVATRTARGVCSGWLFLPAPR